ncbi:hypothetical protein CesoFtcFv8_026513 [Champsocephalus esox]|uniref:Uncharacterized protein n=1 Tax=Champsocephalus esox TaxID=159716 RepID=A0AAN8AZA3_9TELE|nr:hypothetical protein CesoFtcFv8_026513 [Champsocephalus esox]
MKQEVMKTGRIQVPTTVLLKTCRATKLTIPHSNKKQMKTQKNLEDQKQRKVAMEKMEMRGRKMMEKMEMRGRKMMEKMEMRGREMMLEIRSGNQRRVTMERRS